MVLLLVPDLALDAQIQCADYDRKCTPFSQVKSDILHLNPLFRRGFKMGHFLAHCKSAAE